MDKSQIVIFTRVNDSHADDVILALQEMGYEPVRLNTDDIPLNTTISLGIGGNGPNLQGLIHILTNGRVIDIDAIRSIWWWRPGFFGLPTDLAEQEQMFATDEIDHMLQGLWASLDCYWISHPAHIRQARWKGGQLLRAARLGFHVPRTLITMDPEAVSTFYDQCNGQILFRVMSDPLLAAEKVAQKHPDQQPELYGTPPTLVTEAELALLDSIRLVPCMFQEYIPKVIDLRVTLIGDEIFAVEIHSQEREETRLDWRYSDVEIPYRKTKLPTEVAELCRALARSYHLNYCTLDLFLTPDGQYVFSEMNPEGQFIFVEERVPELRMTEALASCLIRGANS